MQVDKNHLGSIINFFSVVANEMGVRFSHGNITETNMRSNLVYPYMHINMSNISIGDVMSTVTVNLMLADRVNIITTENEDENESLLYSKVGFTENNNYAMVLQQLYGDFVIAYKKYEMQFYNAMQIQKPFQLTPFEESYDDVLAGFTASLNIEVVNPIVTDGFC